MKSYLHVKTSAVSVIFKKHFKRFHFIFFFLFFLFSCWLMFHTFSYDGSRHEIKIAYKLWSDFGAHIPLIRSFSMGDNLPRLWRGLMPQYPIFPGEPIRYHFLFYMFVGILEKLGLRIDWALNVPSILGFFALLVSVYVLTLKLFKSKWVGILTIVFFLFNGSFGFVRFFTLHPLSSHTILDIIHAKDFPAFAPWGPGEVSAFWNLNIYTNQRHLAAAFSLAILFILTCLHVEQFRLKKQIPWAIVWGVIFGSLPYFHQPTLLIVAIIMATYMLAFPKLRMFLFTCGLLTTVIVIPQLLIASGAGNPAVWYPGYIIHNEVVNQKLIVPVALHLASFWFLNLGLHSILIAFGFFLIPRRTRLVLLPIIPLFIIPNLFKFSVEASANHKFFNFFMLLGSMISAYVIVQVVRSAKQKIKIRLPARHRFTQAIAGGFVYSFIGLLLILLTLSGVIDFFVVFNDTKGSVTDIPKNEIATWIGNNTPKNSVFLNSSYLYHPASLAGRFIFLGWPYFAWSAGYKTNRMPIVAKMYESRDTQNFCRMLKSNALSYVTVEDVKNDPNLPRIDLAYYLKSYTPVFTSRDKRYAIFRTSDICNTR